MSTILLDRPATAEGPTAAHQKCALPSSLQCAVPTMPMAVSASLLDDILQPYHPAARYLKSAAITHFRDKSAEGVHANRGLISARGTFSICESCYIQSTGHFNAVEFNICFNQLAYVTFGKCIDAGLMHKLRCGKNEVPSFTEFKKHQLPNMVIVQIESRYYHQLDSGAFEGTLELNRIAPVGNAWFFFTTMTFADDEAIKAKGKVVLAFSPAFKPITH